MSAASAADEVLLGLGQTAVSLVRRMDWIVHRAFPPSSFLGLTGDIGTPCRDTHPHSGDPTLTRIPVT